MTRSSLYSGCLLLAILLFSCHRDSGKETITVSGVFRNGAGRSVFFREMTPSGIRTLDSARLGVSGHYSFSLKRGEAGFYVLSAGDHQNLVLTLEKGDKAGVSGDLDSALEGARITGSDESRRYGEFYGESMANLEIADSLEKILKENLGSDEFYRLSTSYDTVFGAILQAQRELEKNYIREHPGSLSSLLVLNFSFGPEPVLSWDRDSALFVLLDTALARKYPGNQHWLFHHQRILEYRREARVKKNL